MPQGSTLRFGEFDQTEDDDELWGEWGGDCSSGPVLCGTRPTETDDNCGFGGGGSAGWGCGDPGGVGTRQERPMAASTGRIPHSPKDLVAGVLGGLFPRLLLQVTRRGGCSRPGGLRVRTGVRRVLMSVCLTRSERTPDRFAGARRSPCWHALARRSGRGAHRA